MAVMVGRLAMMFSVVGGKRVGRHEVAADRGMRWQEWVGAGGGVLFQDRDKTELLVIIGYVNNGVPMIPMHDNEDQQSKRLCVN